MEYSYKTEDLESRTAAEILYWAAKTFGSKLALTSSFQTQSLPLLYLVSKICPNVPVFFLDTGFHFKETIEFRNQLKRELGINIVTLLPLCGHEDFIENHGELHQTNQNMCCYMNKVEPLQRALAGYDAWISGVRRDQTDARKNTPVIAMQNNGLYKVCPMVHWTSGDVQHFMVEHKLHSHPLSAKGYRSIGCEPCTSATKATDDARAGRWDGSTKTECGLHLDFDNVKSDSCNDK
jgi:phosphoadenosine phosphosulfate reductase